jgi:hypothetical protein
MGPKKIWGRRRATQGLARPMTPITSSNPRSSSPHRDRARCALTALPCAAVYYPTVLRFDGAIGQRPSARFGGEWGQASHQSGAATVTSEVTPPTLRRSPKRVHQESSNHATGSGDALIARGSGSCRAHLIAHRRGPLPTPAAVCRRFHYFDVLGTRWSPPSHGYLEVTLSPLARHAPCKSITPFNPIIPSMHRRSWSYPSYGARMKYNDV